MRKILSVFLFLLIGLTANADYSFQTYDTFYNPSYNSSYNSFNNPSVKTYTEEYYPNNPYHNHYTQQCVNPYQHRRRYKYRNNLPYLYGNNVSTNQGVVRNIGQSLLYSMLRGQ